ncbi:MAG: DivIVA domain-containing protein [Solirubrobacteraceae bacterium]
MDKPPEGIRRRDFPRTADGYDPEAVDAHLEAIAAAVAAEPAAGRGRSAAADREVVAAARLLLSQISALRVELKDVSVSLRERSLRISDALEALLEHEGELEDEPPRLEVSAPAEEPGGAEPREPAGWEPAAAPAELAPAELPPAELPLDAALEAGVADARLVALDMALGGSDREEIERELAARFELPDRAGLVDEVLAALG